MDKIFELQKKLDKNNIDSFIVTNSSNLFYLLSENVNGYLVVKPDSVHFLTSNFYRYTVRDLDLESSICENVAEDLSNLELGGDLVSDNPLAVTKKVDINVKRSELVSEMRSIKDSEEIRLITKSSQISTAALGELYENMDKSSTEWGLASIADNFMRCSNSYNAFDTLVHCNTCEPHRTLENKRIGNNLVIVDFGARYRGYCSDITRTFCLNPNEEQKKLYDDVLDLYNMIFSKIEPGETFSDIARYGRKLVVEKGYSIADNFLHSLGHSLGVDIHEKPRFGLEESHRIERGMVFTLEPGLYLPEVGGVRIEDTIHINDKGEKEVLTQFPKGLLP